MYICLWNIHKVIFEAVYAWRTVSGPHNCLGSLKANDESRNILSSSFITARPLLQSRWLTKQALNCSLFEYMTTKRYITKSNTHRDPEIVLLSSTFVSQVVTKIRLSAASPLYGEICFPRCTSLEPSNLALYDRMKRHS